MRIRVITDSSTNVPDEYLQRLAIVEVPAIVNFGAESFLNKVEITTAEFYRRLAAAEKLPTTAQPTPQQFAQAYAHLAAEGAEEIIVVTVSHKLSGTFNSAMIAVEHAPVKVHVWDGLSVSVGAGMQAIAAAEMAQAGLTSAEILRRLTGIRARMYITATPATLRNLIASGRAPKLQGSIGDLLDIKPILAIVDGLLDPVGRARGRRRALQAMLDQVAIAVGTGPARAGIAHANVPEEAAEFAQMVRARLNGAEVMVLEIGPVLATLGGPGIIALGAYAVGD
jgi:DegV family protein with EDD domain